MNIASVPPLFVLQKQKLIIQVVLETGVKRGFNPTVAKGHCLTLNKLKLQVRWSRYKTWTLHGLWNGLWTALESIKFNLIHRPFLLVKEWGLETRLGHLSCTTHIPLSTMVLGLHFSVYSKFHEHLCKIA